MLGGRPERSDVESVRVEPVTRHTGRRAGASGRRRADRTGWSLLGRSALMS